MRPILRPGSHVLRRNRHEIQVGLDPQHAVVLPDDRDTRSSLALLSRSADARDYDDPRTLDLLRKSGLLLDGSRFLPLIPADGTAPATKPRGGPATPRHDVAALARSAGDDAADLLAARDRCLVEVRSFADLGNDRLAQSLSDLLREGGVQARRPTAHTSRAQAARAVQPVPPSKDGPREVAALVGVGEPRRELLDEWMRVGAPHVLVRLSEGSTTVGPFVVPGQTACLRCIDAHHTDADQAWPLLVAQYAALSGNERVDGVPEPVDSLIASVALAWAARDLTSYAEGRRPSTWSTTIRFDPHLACLEARRWLRHPECGCAWV